jgi:hypothetical protein
MNLTRDRLRSIGWVTLLSICTALTAALTLRVNAVKSEVHQAERQIIGMRNEIAFLETEFQTRSNQHQLKTLNDVEFGYVAPRAQQYIEGERQLAVLGHPRGPGSPAPIRVALAPTVEGMSSTLPMASPVARKGSEGAVTGRAKNTGAQAVRTTGSDDPIGGAIDAESLGAWLTRASPEVASQ